MSVKMYNGSMQIAELTESGRKTLKTGGKYVPNDIVVDYTADGGGTVTPPSRTAYDEYQEKTITFAGGTEYEVFDDFVPDKIIVTLATGQEYEILFNDITPDELAKVAVSGISNAYFWAMADVNACLYGFYRGSGTRSDPPITLPAPASIRFIHYAMIDDHCPSASIGCQSSYDDLIAGAEYHYREPWSGFEADGVTPVYQRDENGNIKYDSDGNPMFDDVKYIWTGSNTASGTAQSPKVYRKQWFKSDNRYGYLENRTTIDWYDDRGTKSSNVCAIYLKSRNYITFENCVFENVKAFHIDDCSHITIKNCIFIGASPLYVQESSDITLDQCTTFANDSGTYVTSLHYVSHGAERVTITRCKIISQGINGKVFRFGHPKGPATNCSVTNCYFTGIIGSVFFELNASSNVSISDMRSDLYRSWLMPADGGSGGVTGYIYSLSAGSASATDCHTNMDCERRESGSGGRISSGISATNVTFSLVDRIAEAGNQSSGSDTPVIPDGYIKPDGAVTLTQNGTYDVTEKATAIVNVPSSSGYPTAGTLSIGDSALVGNKFGWDTNDTTSALEIYTDDEAEEIGFTFYGGAGLYEDENFVPVGDSAIVDKNTTIIAGMSYPKVAEAIGLTPAMLVAGASVLGINGTASSGGVAGLQYVDATSTSNSNRTLAFDLSSEPSNYIITAMDANAVNHYFSLYRRLGALRNSTYYSSGSAGYKVSSGTEYQVSIKNGKLTLNSGSGYYIPTGTYRMIYW